MEDKKKVNIGVPHHNHSKNYWHVYFFSFLYYWSQEVNEKLRIRDEILRYRYIPKEKFHSIEAYYKNLEEIEDMSTLEVQLCRVLHTQSIFIHIFSL